jgi:hypothetical protein
MKRVTRCSCATVRSACAALLLSCGAASAQSGEGAVLMLRLDSGQVDPYLLSEIQRFTFTGEDTLLVDASGPAGYLLESVRVITFDTAGWAGIDDPSPPHEAIGTLHLTQNRPNPFSPETRMAFMMPQEGRAELRIYSVDGRLVRTLIDGHLPAGPYTAIWDGRDESGRAVASGVYFCSLAALGTRDNMKMLLVR